MAGITTWNYFKECLTATSDTFKKNEQIFGKVYFPRIIMPMSIVVSNLLKFGIQLTHIHCLLIYYYALYAWLRLYRPSDIHYFLFPVLVLCYGIVRFRTWDGNFVNGYKIQRFNILVSFGIQLLMYISLVVIPLSLFQEKGVEWLVMYNPMGYIIEMARFLLLNEGNISQFGIIYTGVSSILIFLLGIVIFNKTEKTFIDTI